MACDKVSDCGCSPAHTGELQSATLSTKPIARIDTRIGSKSGTFEVLKDMLMPH